MAATKKRNTLIAIIGAFVLLACAPQGEESVPRTSLTLDEVTVGELQEMMQDKVGIIREDGLMREAIDDIAKLAERAPKAAAPGNREYNPGWHTALDLKCLLTVSEASARAALERRESRGAQTRNDFPDKDPDDWGRHNLLIRKGVDGAMEVEKVPVVPQTEPQKKIIKHN